MWRSVGFCEWGSEDGGNIEDEATGSADIGTLMTRCTDH
jgi:hypothetical protein